MTHRKRVLATGNESQGTLGICQEVFVLAGQAGGGGAQAGSAPCASAKGAGRWIFTVSQPLAAPSCQKPDLKNPKQTKP